MEVTLQLQSLLAGGVLNGKACHCFNIIGSSDAHRSFWVQVGKRIRLFSRESRHRHDNAVPMGRKYGGQPEQTAVSGSAGRSEECQLGMVKLAVAKRTVTDKLLYAGIDFRRKVCFQHVWRNFARVFEDDWNLHIGCVPHEVISTMGGYSR